MTQQLLTSEMSHRQEMSLSSRPQSERFASYETTNSTAIPRKEYSESVTTQERMISDLPRMLIALCAAAKKQYFEDGMDSAFSIELIQCIKQYGDHTINELAHLILNKAVDDEVASEALRQLGHIDHPASYKARRWLLERSLLACASALVRDGALLGLALLDDRHAMPYVRRAIQQEQCPELRESMLQLLEQLESAS